MRTMLSLLAFAAALSFSGCKKKATEVVDEVQQNNVEVALQVVAVSPGTIAAGRETTVTIVGSGFVTGLTARVGTQAVPVSFKNANQAEAKLPALAAGIYDVTVMLPDTTDATLPSGLSVRGESTGVGGATIDSCRKVVLYFETGSATLTSESRQLLTSLVPCFNSSAVALLVQGHADERDTTDFNLALGQRRAQSVSQTLAELGVPRQRLQVMSFGEERPVEQGSGEGTWAKNRRVEILVD